MNPKRRILGRILGNGLMWMVQPLMQFTTKQLHRISVAIVLSCLLMESVGAYTKPPQGYIHRQTDPRYVIFEAEYIYQVIDIGVEGYRLVEGQPEWTNRASNGKAIFPVSSDLTGNGGMVHYKIVFNTAATYGLYYKYSLLNLGGGSDEDPVNYNDNNSIIMPFNFNEQPVWNSDDCAGALDNHRRIMFPNSQWDLTGNSGLVFPHDGDYRWNTTEEVIYHNYSVFPVIELEVQPQDVGQELNLYLRLRESGWAFDVFALVNTSILPLSGDGKNEGDNHLWDGEYIVRDYNDGWVSYDPPGDGCKKNAIMTLSFDWPPYGNEDAVRVHPGHLGYWQTSITPENIYMWFLDLNRDGNGDNFDGNAGHYIIVNGTEFANHYAGYDPDLGITPEFLNNLLSSSNKPAPAIRR